MKRKLYDDNDLWTPDAEKLSRKLIKRLKPVFASYARKGFSIRDVADVTRNILDNLEIQYTNEVLLDSFELDLKEDSSETDNQEVPTDSEGEPSETS